jgi:hypothetical protein
VRGRTCCLTKSSSLCEYCSGGGGGAGVYKNGLNGVGVPHGGGLGASDAASQTCAHRGGAQKRSSALTGYMRLQWLCATCCYFGEVWSCAEFWICHARQTPAALEPCIIARTWHERDQ